MFGDINELESVFDGDTDGYFCSSNGKQLWVDKLSYIVTHSDGTKEKKTKFRVWRDYGNAVYASWMCWFLGQEQAYRVFSTDNEEKLEMGWRLFSGSSTSYPASERNCQRTFATTDQSWKPRS